MKRNPVNLSRREFFRTSLLAGAAGVVGFQGPSILAGRRNDNLDDGGDPVHSEVFRGDGYFAAWPANHGIWSWDDEILVGFQVARHQERSGHSWDPATSRHKFGRSLDGGVTWSVEDAFESGITAEATGHRLGDLAVEPGECPGGIEFTHPDFALTFRRRRNVAGPSCFFYSYDRGKSWKGPYAFPDLGTRGVATRTEYLVQGKHELLAFLTTAKDDGQIGWSACARTGDGGKSWTKLSWIETEPEGQAIMPAAVRLSSSKILAVVRRTGDRSRPGARKWLSSYLSEDNGSSWRLLGEPADKLGWNSHPPALLKLRDGRLNLTYAVRGSPSRVVTRFSSDEGRNWGDEIVLRDGDGANRDMGYPRVVQRTDGKVVVVYYYNHALDDAKPPYRYIAATLFDPEEIV